MNELPLRLHRPLPFPARPLAAARVSSRELLKGRRELVIEHHGQEYRLILTRNDKLILNK